MKKTSFPNLLTALAILCAAFMLTGCFETMDEFTMNMDGSGKVVHESTFQNLNLSDQEDNSEAALKAAIARVMDGAKGVEAWRDVSYKRLEDGRLYFKGTAYFKDLSKLDIPNQTLLEFNWTNTARGVVLTLRTNKEETAAGGVTIKKKKTDLSLLTPEQRAAKIKEERAKFQQSKPFMAGIVGGMKQDVIFHLPGKVQSVSNFTEDPSGTLRLKVEGTKLLDAMDQLIKNDSWLEKNINNVAGDSNPPMDDDINALLFGSKGPVQATIAGVGAPAFDYASEVAAAKKEFAGIQKQLGTSPVTVAPPAQSGALKSLKVVGVRLIRESDNKREIRPFNYDEGYTLALLAEFPGSILAITDKSMLDSAITDDGTSLLPDTEWKRRFSLPKLSVDKAAVVLEAQLNVPGPNVQGLKELSGHLQYNVGGATKEVDLGFTELKDDARGTIMGAQIQSIKEGWQKNGSQRLALKLNTKKEALKALYVVAGDSRTELDQRGYGGGGNTYTFTYESKGPMPQNGKLVAEMYDQLQTFDVDFKLEDISLLGEPLKPAR